MGFRTTQCPVCHVLRAVKDWREHHETVEIELDPCGHVVRRSARLEWRVRKAAA
jgi:Zn ribbon nucleic-acid-binding protein